MRMVKKNSRERQTDRQTDRDRQRQKQIVIISHNLLSSESQKLRCSFHLFQILERSYLRFESEKAIYKSFNDLSRVIVQELCESRGGRPGLSVLTSLLVSVDVKIY